MSRPDVIVIGAGFAGLSAAVRLVQAGARVVVVEQHRRLGGRATAFADPQSGEVVDNGQHVLFGCYRETFAFLRAIDAYGNVALDERLDIEVVDRQCTRSRLVTPAWAPPLHLVGGLLRWSALGLRDRAAALRMGLVLRRLSRQGGADSWKRLDGADGRGVVDRMRADATAARAAVGAAGGGGPESVAGHGCGRAVCARPRTDVQRHAV